ncbi:p-loop containing nucleoside triphosphate hydrolase protein [Penicillium subrubescens]|uniref:p-loop containing nucleoside triphosphate hydrolase protein n=1 Tax=Penicillium subrubescens TaxID=1316194 RepID=UPI002545B3DA|nr:p-loop containing nucleoside triphosphate hydrolase protein [Penicillium subrubescens]KAJ5882701.1 p-loop containing nucleoside triphosphate hydrolase protein [Penicillium subrubescens]
MDRYQVNLIDTPGFDDTKMEESHVLAIITDYLKSGVRLSGILYLHPLNRGRMGWAATRNLGMIQNLVGPENMKMVRLITTMWDRVSPKDGQDEVEELQEEFWSEILAAGAKTDRCIDATEDGKRIIRSILKSPPVRLKFQKEIENGVEPAATAAGKFVADKIVELLGERVKEIKVLQDQLAGLTCDRTKEAERERASQENLQKLNEAQESIKDLKEELRKLKESVADLENSKSGGCIIL